MSCEICTDYSSSADFGEAHRATFPSLSLRRTRMTEPQRLRKRRFPPHVQNRQMSIAFESSGIHGLTDAQRLKAVAQLSQVLILAAGVAPKESHDER
jgi:hypothetical protein